MIPLIMFCHRFVRLRSLKLCFPNSPPSQGIPISASSYAAYNRLSNAFCNPTYSQPFCFNDDEFEIVGYRGNTCGSCLTNHPLAIYTRKQPVSAQQRPQQQIIPTTYQCDSQRLINCSSLPTKAKNEIIVILRYRLSENHGSSECLD